MTLRKLKYVTLASKFNIKRSLYIFFFLWQNPFCVNERRIGKERDHSYPNILKKIS